MTLSVELPEELALRLEAAGIRSEDAQRYAIAALSEAADSAEIRAWWNGLEATQQAAEARKTRDSIAAIDAGRSSPAADVYARVRGKSAAGNGE